MSSAIDIGKLLNDNFWPPFLHIILPVLILALVFYIVWKVCVCLLRGHRIWKVLVGYAIVLVVVVACARIMPAVIKTVPI